MSSQQTQTGAVGFHSGELAAQRRAGVEAEAARLRPMMGPGELRGGAAALLAHASFAAITARDRDGRLWISPMAGPPGFLAAATPTRLSLRDTLPVGDPLHGLHDSQPVGIVVMDFAAKRRVRINGTLTATDGGMLQVDVTQAYGNCPQYIHPRAISAENEVVATDLHIERNIDIACRRHCTDPVGGYIFPWHHSSRARQRRVASRRSGRIRARRSQHRPVAGLRGQQHVQQLRQSRDRPDSRAAVHRLRQRAHTSAVWQGCCRMGEVSRARRHRPLGALHHRTCRREPAALGRVLQEPR